MGICFWTTQEVFTYRYMLHPLVYIFILVVGIFGKLLSAERKLPGSAGNIAANLMQLGPNTAIKIMPATGSKVTGAVGNAILPSSFIQQKTSARFATIIDWRLVCRCCCV